MTLFEHQQVFTKHFTMLVMKALELEFKTVIAEVQRPVEMQKIYVQTKRSMTMKSMHLQKCAGDLVMVKDGKICSREDVKPLGDYWESLDPLNRWGGSWRGLVEAGKSSFIDTPHFERKC